MTTAVEGDPLFQLLLRLLELPDGFFEAEAGGLHSSSFQINLKRSFHSEHRTHPPPPSPTCSLPPRRLRLLPLLDPWLHRFHSLRIVPSYVRSIS